MTGARIAALTSLALVAFAMNSILCRLALAEGRIDAATFTFVRLVSGAAVLVLLAARRLRPWPGSIGSTLALFLYAAPFSFAYLRLATGTGALLLFACVQATMIGAGFLAGERLTRVATLGFACALAGLVVLVAPGLDAPPLGAACAMAIAGVAWGVYSLRGRAASGPPLATTAANFVGTLPFAAAVAATAWSTRQAIVRVEGVALAVASGALASGLGYAVWYTVLPQLGAARAGMLQLLVPVLAAFGGVVLVGEAPTPRLVVASIAILGGVGVAVRGAAARTSGSRG